jgi:uncharacterized membrane protein
MKRDTKIVMAVLSAMPAAILSASVLTTWLVAHGAPLQLRLLFRLLCHGIALRCIHLWSVPMPICARCTGIYLGLLLGLIAFLAVPFVSRRWMRNVAIVAVMPLAIDGLTQLARLRESTNELRIGTGLAAGFAFGMWILSAIERRGEMQVTSP